MIELLIYSSILIVILMFTGEYLYSIGQARINNTARLEITQAAELIISKVRSDITNSSVIAIPSDNETSINLNLTSGDDTIAYSLNDSTLFRAVNGVSDYLNSNQVRISNINFNRIANPGGVVTIQMQFTLNSVAQLSGGRNLQESFQTTFAQKQ